MYNSQLDKLMIKFYGHEKTKKADRKHITNTCARVVRGRTRSVCLAPGRANANRRRPREIGIALVRSKRML